MVAAPVAHSDLIVFPADSPAHIATDAGAAAVCHSSPEQPQSLGHGTTPQQGGRRVAVYLVLRYNGTIQEISRTVRKMWYYTVWCLSGAVHQTRRVEYGGIQTLSKEAATGLTIKQRSSEKLAITKLAIQSA